MVLESEVRTRQNKDSVLTSYGGSSRRRDASLELDQALRHPSIRWPKGSAAPGHGGVPELGPR